MPHSKRTTSLPQEKLKHEMVKAQYCHLFAVRCAGWQTLLHQPRQVLGSELRVSHCDEREAKAPCSLFRDSLPVHVLYVLGAVGAQQFCVREVSAP